jgi:hypothetical protein
MSEDELTVDAADAQAFIATHSRATLALLLFLVLLATQGAAGAAEAGDVVVGTNAGHVDGTGP